MLHTRINIGYYSIPTVVDVYWYLVVPLEYADKHHQLVVSRSDRFCFLLRTGNRTDEAHAGEQTLRWCGGGGGGDVRGCCGTRFGRYLGMRNRFSSTGAKVFFFVGVRFVSFRFVSFFFSLRLCVFLRFWYFPREFFVAVVGGDVVVVARAVVVGVVVSG